MDFIKQNFKVSIVIPYYKHIKFIEQTITSALAQTYENIEVVVVNDGSPDDFDKIIQPYLRHPKLKYIYQQNGGVCSARNTGIRHASGQLILTLDCDDVMLPGWVEDAVAMLTSDRDLITTPYEYYNSDLVPMNFTWVPHTPVGNEILYNNTVGSSSLYFKTLWEEAGGYDENFLYLEDWEYWIRMWKIGANIKVLPQSMVKFRRHEENHSDAFNSISNFFLRQLKKKHNIS